MAGLYMSRSSVACFLYEFLSKCNNSGLFPQIIDKHNLLFIKKFPLDANFFFLMQLFSSHASIFKEEVARIFIQTLRELDPGIQKLVLFQFKLDIESKFTGYFTNIEWEKMRYENIQDYTKVILQGYCKGCRFYPFQLDILKFLEMTFIFAIPADGRRYFQRINCVKWQQLMLKIEIARIIK